MSHELKRTTFARMFVRKKKNKTGSVSVQAIEKSVRCGYRVKKTFGCSSDSAEVELLYREACRWVDEQQNGLSLFPDEDWNARLYDIQFESLSQKQLRLVGPELIFGTLFDKIGYGYVKTDDTILFRALVVARLYHPGSKLKTVEYLQRFMHIDYSVDKVYRFLDKLCVRADKKDAVEEEGVKWQVEQISFAHTKKVMGGEISVVFYDTTTLYFESREDDIRVPGYSKDGKHSNPQVVLGLLVGTGGNPIGYELHKGNKYEGETLIPIIQKMEKRFGLQQPMVIADAGLLNKANITALEDNGYHYILGARIRSLKQELKDDIQGKNLTHGQSTEIIVDNRRLIVTMSDKRAQKDAVEREKGIIRLQRKFASGKITKQSVNNRGYNSLLSIDGEMTVSIDEAKIEAAAKLDGLKGYITNSLLSIGEIVDNYRNLFLIERAFRFNKTDLDIRPMYHRLFNRIEAHVCICFTAYTIMLELERVLKASGCGISLHRAMILAENIHELTYVNPYSKKRKSVLLKTDHDEEVTTLLKLVGKNQS